ncbi:MAG: tRNA (adenosine(37)-N6)-threonylcarbamoyltransferase complex dimerization subunit type 1 TsaB [Pseudomonadota bacterium]
MFTLAFDTCLDACSVALIDGRQGTMVAARHELMNRGQAEALFPMIDETVNEAGLAPGDIAQVAVTSGPGTFTGVRIGLAAARGLAVASDLPVIALSSLHAIALCAIAADEPQCPVAALIDARRDEIYLAVYGPSGEEQLAPRAVPVDDALAALPDGDVLLAGSGAKLLSSGGVMSSAHELPNAAVWGLPASRMPASDTPPSPLYLRAADAKPPGAGAQVQRA